MLVTKPPMGYNTWNTFGNNINEQLLIEITDAMVEKGYRDSGYEYVVIDDCWSEKERDENGLLVADKDKFPHGMKYISDYVHSKGMKFGMYSCAGVRTCADYPSSYQHEFDDARTFASWGVDFLKYDFCNFPKSADCKTAYLTMSNALKASGRDILFSACNWGVEEPWNWMRTIGVHMFRSTGDIFDNFISMRDIAKSQFDKFNSSSYGCFNDIDMLTVGMHGSGNVAVGEACSDIEYETHFVLWCLLGSPLMIGGDIRQMNDFCHKLLLNKDLIEINQDRECRPPYIINVYDDGYVMLKFLENNEYALGIFNFSDQERSPSVLFTDLGFPVYASKKYELKNLITKENITVDSDYYCGKIKPHSCNIFRMKITDKNV